MCTWDGVGWLDRSMSALSGLDMISMASSSEESAGFLADLGVFFFAADASFVGPAFSASGQDPRSLYRFNTGCLGHLQDKQSDMSPKLGHVWRPTFGGRSCWLPGLLWGRLCSLLGVLGIGRHKTV